MSTKKSKTPDPLRPLLEYAAVMLTPVKLSLIQFEKPGQDGPGGHMTLCQALRTERPANAGKTGSTTGTWDRYTAHFIPWMQSVRIVYDDGRTKESQMVPLSRIHRWEIAK